MSLSRWRSPRIRQGRSGGVARLWISSLSGGAPVLLTNSERTVELGGSWSPDGSRFVYVAYEGGKTSLMTVKTSGGATPIKLIDMGKRYDLPDWSSTRDWITYHDDKGWNLISPDGKRTKFLSKIQADYLAFSKDGKVLYGIQTGETEADQDHATLFSLDTATLKQKVIKNLGGDFAPSSKFHPGIRFSLSPDGKSFVYSTARYRNDLWLLQGYRRPGLLIQIKTALPGHFFQ